MSYNYIRTRLILQQLHPLFVESVSNTDGDMLTQIKQNHLRIFKYIFKLAI